MAFSLSSLLGGLKVPTFSGGDGSFVGLDIGAASAKIVQLRSAHGAAVLETYGEIALGPYGDVAIGKAVKLAPERAAQAILDLMKEANVTAKQGAVSIPFSASLVNVIEMPKAPPDQLRRMIPIEARKYIPVPVSEVTLDWFIIPQDEEGEKSAFDRIDPASVPSKVRGQEILLAAIQNDTLRAYQTIASTVSLGVKFFEIEIFSAIRSSLGHGVAPMLIIDIGASSTKMYVVERGVVKMTHLQTFGGQQITENLARTLTWEFEKAERVKREHGLMDTSAFSTDENERIRATLLSTLSRIFTEANKVLLSYGKRYNKVVSKVILSGGGAALPGLEAAAHNELQAEVALADPFARTETPAFLSNVLSEIGPSFAVAIGLALRGLRGS